MSHRTVLRFAILVFLAIASSASAQTESIPGRGTEIFQGLLKYQRFKPISAAEFIAAPSADTLVVLIGRLPNPGDPVASAIYDKHLKNGGAVFIASDQPRNFGYLIPGGSGTGIDNNQLICTNADEQYDQNPLRFYAKMTSVPGFPAVKLATESPSWIVTGFRSRLLSQVIATHPSPLFSVRNGMEAALGKNVVFGMRSAPDLDCRVYVFANRALVENRMMVLNDPKQVTTPGLPSSGNFLASFFISQDLATGGTKRTKCLYLEDGQAVTSFDRVSLQAGEPPIPPVQPPIPLKRILDLLAEKMNEQIDKQERKYNPDDYFAKDANDANGRGRRRWLQWLIPLAFATVVLPAVVLLWRGWSRKTNPVEATRISFAEAAAIPSDGLMSQRRWEAMESGSVAEPMREYLRSLFESWGVPSGYTGAMPTIALAGEKRRFGRAMVESIEKLWRIAYEDEKVSADTDELLELEAMVKTVSDAARAKSWTLTLAK